MGRADWNHWYSSKRWRRLRAEILAKQKYCQCPSCKGKFIEGDVVDHIVPHKGDTKLFWDKNNLQVLTKQCHDSAKARFEISGYWVGCDASGTPVDPDHHWND